MIKYLENQEIDMKKWDSCIDNAVNSRIYANSWYLNTVAPDWGALVLDDYQAVFPIVSRKKMGISYSYQPVFTQQLGLFSPLLITPQLVDSFLKKLKDLFPLIQINLNSYNKVNSTNFGVKKMVNYELDLISPYEMIKKNYSKNLKRNIKKAQKAKLSIFKNLKPEAVINLFKENRGKNIQNLNDEEYQKLNRLVYKAIGMNKVEIWGTFTEENNLCAAAIFVNDQRRQVFLFSAINKEARTNGAMSYLIDSFIEAHSETKKTMDFEGSNDANLARFYKSFGSTKVHYPHIFLNNLPWYLSIAWKLKQKIA